MGAHLRYQRWVKEFKPIKNPFRDTSEIDGYVFFDYGEEADFIRRQPAECVWTFVVCDGPRSSTWLISSGYHSIDRMGYLVTARPCLSVDGLDVQY